jgi:hypothetical protein
LHIEDISITKLKEIQEKEKAERERKGEEEKERIEREKRETEKKLQEEAKKPQAEIRPRAASVDTPSQSPSEASPSQGATSEHTVQRKTSSKFGLAKIEKCVVCDKTVYPVEKAVVGIYIYHTKCMKCAHCNRPLTLVLHLFFFFCLLLILTCFSLSLCLWQGNYAALEGTLYCKPHFTQLFKAKVISIFFSL